MCEEVTAEITGGGKRARFYSNVSYYRNGDFLDFGEAKNNMTVLTAGIWKRRS